MDTNNSKKSKKNFAGPLIALSVKGTKLIKVVKVFKPLVTILTMLGSLMAYSAAFGIYFAIGLISMLFIHEMGHVIALK